MVVGSITVGKTEVDMDMFFFGGKGGKNTYTHRIVYEVLNGKITSDQFVCHKCDNPACCNPEHLFLGTHDVNMKDMKNKKRNFLSYGEKSGMHKLTRKQVEDIRNDNRKQIDIAESYGVAKSTISMIKN